MLLENQGLVLAPYHTFYPRLQEHLQGPWGVDTSPNQWNNPLLLGTCITISFVKGSVQKLPLEGTVGERWTYICMVKSVPK